MIIVPVKDGESIEKSLKKFKKKIEKTGMVRELRERTKFTKPSVVKRMQKIKAVYVQKMHHTMPVFSIFFLNFFSDFSIDSPSLTGTIIILFIFRF